ILLGYTLGGVARGLAVGLIVTLMSLFFTRLQVQHIALTIGVVFLTSLVFSRGGFINAVYARSFDDISIVPTFVLTPLTYLGGVVYSINLLRDFWQGVSLINPILHMINAFRLGMWGVWGSMIGRARGLRAVFGVGLYLLRFPLLGPGVGLRNRRPPPAVGLGAGDGYACGLTGRRPADASGRTVAARQDQRIQWNLHPLSSIPDPASADLGRTGAGPAASAVPWCRCLEQL